MKTHYYVEVKVGKKWILLKSFTRHTDSLHYVKEHGAGRYPIRVVKSSRTIVFQEHDGKKGRKSPASV